MTKKEFYIKYNPLLQLDEKKWDYSNAIHSNLKVSISGYREIDKDFLYYIVNNEIWEINLPIVYDWLSPVHSLRDVMKLAFKDKTDKYGRTTDGKPITMKYILSGVYGRVEIDLDVFGKKVYEEPVVFREKLTDLDDLFINLKDYINKSPTVESVFKDKCERGRDIDVSLNRIKSELNKRDLVLLVENLILTLKEKNWINFKDL